MTDTEIAALMGWPEEYMAGERDPLSMVARVRAVVAAAEAGERERWRIAVLSELDSNGHAYAIIDAAMREG